MNEPIECPEEIYRDVCLAMADAVMCSITNRLSHELECMQRISK